MPPVAGGYGHVPSGPAHIAHGTVPSAHKGRRVRHSLGVRPDLARTRHPSASPPFRVTTPAQTTACNALHSAEQRCCRWLLMTHDLVGNDELKLTHEFLAIMLGV